MSWPKSPCTFDIQTRHFFSVKGKIFPVEFIKDFLCLRKNIYAFHMHSPGHKRFALVLCCHRNVVIKDNATTHKHAPYGEIQGKFKSRLWSNFAKNYSWNNFCPFLTAHPWKFLGCFPENTFMVSSEIICLQRICQRKCFPAKLKSSWVVRRLERTGGGEMACRLCQEREKAFPNKNMQNSFIRWNFCTVKPSISPSRTRTYTEENINST